MSTLKIGGNRPLQGGLYPYVYVDGSYLRRNWGGEFENVAILVAIAVNEDGYREVLGAADGVKEDKASWVSFFQWLRSRGLDGVKLIVGNKCLGMLEAVGEVFPEAKYQLRTPPLPADFIHHRVSKPMGLLTKDANTPFPWDGKAVR